ncbi:MAG: hypothetical protein RLZZ450_2361 [Pseudomonadota bacterium]|jgi:hypothetical protein
MATKSATLSIFMLGRQPPLARVPRLTLEQHHAECVVITGCARGRSGGLLGCHERGGAAQLSILERVADAPWGAFDREPEVEHHDARLGRDQHVAGLEVAVQLASPMDRVDGRHELRKGRAQARLMKSALRAYPLIKRHSFDHLHREEPAGLFHEQLVQAHDVRVAERTQRAELVLESIHVCGVALAQQLERDAPLSLLVESLEHHPRAALSELSKQAYATC